MQAYLVNLDRSADRLAHMQAEFARRGIAFERIAAVDARDPAVAAIAATLGPNLQGRVISSGAYGCFQSHRLIWQRLLDSGDSHAMAIEDDLLLAEDFAGFLQDGWVPADADLVKLEAFGERTHLSRSPVVPLPGRRLLRLRSKHRGTGCYVISAAAARRLLDATVVVTDAIDEVMFNSVTPFFESACIYQAIPAPAMQADRLGAQRPAWAGSAIGERYNVAATSDMLRRESPAARLTRRLREEMRALSQGTHYALVDFA